jgi:hypothetical protein
MSANNKYGMLITSFGGWNHVDTYASRAELLSGWNTGEGSTGWKSSRDIHKAAKIIAQWGSSKAGHSVLICKKIKRKGWKVIKQIDMEFIAE